jgi:N-methylhydantoinase A
MRYKGQGMQLTVDFAPEDFRTTGLRQVAARFDEVHTQLFTFALDAAHELVNLRAIVQGRETLVKPEAIAHGTANSAGALAERTTLYIGGADLPAAIYDRNKLKAGNRIVGPAVVIEMDATALILPNHVGEIDTFGNILIRPAK